MRCRSDDRLHALWGSNWQLTLVTMVKVFIRRIQNTLTIGWNLIVVRNGNHALTFCSVFARKKSRQPCPQRISTYIHTYIHGPFVCWPFQSQLFSTTLPSLAAITPSSPPGSISIGLGFVHIQILERGGRKPTSYFLLALDSHNRPRKVRARLISAASSQVLHGMIGRAEKEEIVFVESTNT